SRLPGDVDGLLRDFFRAQMPEMWPDLKPAARPASRRAGSSLIRSRGVLAASVLLLLTGFWWVSGMHSDAVPNLVNGAPGNKVGTKPTDGPHRRMKFTSLENSEKPQSVPHPDGRGSRDR